MMHSPSPRGRTVTTPVAAREARKLGISEAHFGLEAPLVQDLKTNERMGRGGDIIGRAIDAQT